MNSTLRPTIPKYILFCFDNCNETPVLSFYTFLIIQNLWLKGDESDPFHFVYIIRLVV